MKNINTNLSELCEGALQERFDHEVAQVVENILDLNTDPQKKRKITIIITAVSDEYRDQMLFSVETKSTLVPRNGVGTKILIDTDGQEVFANELKSNQKGQMFFDVKDSTLKDDTGKPVDEIEKEEAQKTEVQGTIIKFTEDKKLKTN